MISANMEIPTMKPKKYRINNIEALRLQYRKYSVLAQKSNEERKAILYTWRECLSRAQREELDQQIRAMALVNDGVGELTALEHIFKLVEFCAFVNDKAILHPVKKEG